MILVLRTPAALAGEPIQCQCNAVPTDCVCCEDQCPACSVGQTLSFGSSQACAALVCNMTCGPAPAPAPAGPTATPFQTYSLSNPLQAEDPTKLIGKFINMLTGIVGSFALLMFVYGGFLLLTSRGNPEQIQKGKNVFIWSIVGLVIIFTSYVVLTNVFKVIGAY